jgi:hypothetical protein
VARALYAVTKSVLALFTRVGLFPAPPAGPEGSTANIVPDTSALVSPVILLPAAGLNPTSPVITEVGMLVIAVPAKTAKPAAFPRPGDVAAYTICGATKKNCVKMMSSIVKNFVILPSIPFLIKLPTIYITNQ